MTLKYLVGVDIGGTAIKIAIFDQQGNRHAFEEIETRRENEGELILADTCAKIREIFAAQDLRADQLLGVGVGVPGLVLDGRTARGSVNLGWKKKDVAGYLEERLGLKCKVGNDANVAALGEFWKGASQGTHSSVLLTLGTGIGGGIIIDDGIISGFLGGAGEIGHFPIHEPVQGRLCGCGSPYCLEAFASAPGVVATYRSLTGKELSCAEIFEAAKAGEKEAGKVVDQMQHLIGKACAFMGVMLNPEMFVIGGGVSKAGQFLLEGIERYYTHYILLPIEGTKFALAELGNEAGVYGAARLILSS